MMKMMMLMMMIIIIIIIIIMVMARVTLFQMATSRSFATPQVVPRRRAKSVEVRNGFSEDDP